MTTDAQSSLLALYRRPDFLLRRAHQLSVGLFEEECRALKLTPAQFGVLTVLAQAPGSDQSTVSRALGFDRVTTLRVIRGLQARGLVQREPAPDHGRRLSLTLTTTGKALLRRAAGPAERSHARLLEPLSSSEQQQLESLLVRLCATLEPHARTAIVPPDVE
jgi:DNA-binding MarR family transcriptional regulator